MSKEACAVILDVGASMGQIINESGETALDKGKKAVQRLLQQKLLFTKQDQIALILCGTEETDNPLSEEGGYEHVTVERPMQKPDLKMLELVDSLEVQDEQADVTDALCVAVDLIVTFVRKRKFTKRIYLITDGGGEVDPENRDQLDEIISGLKDNDVRLNVIGIGFEPEEDEDESDEEEDKEAGEGAEKKEGPKRTDVQVETEKILKGIVEKMEGNGQCFTAADALQLMASFHRRTVAQRTKFRGDFWIGPKCKISVYSYGKTMTQNMPSLKKGSTVAEDEAGVVKMDRTYWNKLRDPAKEVDFEERTKGYKYGKRVIPVAAVDEDVMKYQCDKEMKLLGFVKAHQVPRHRFMSGVDCLVAAPGNEESTIALSALINACNEMNMRAIVRYVKRGNSQPWLAILSPVVKPEYECFYINQLPFQEDCRDFSFPTLKTTLLTPSSEEMKAAAELIQALDLEQVEDEDREPCEALRPKYLFNPCIQRFYQSVEKRALDPNAPIQELDPIMAKYMSPDGELLKKSCPVLERFKATFNLRVLEKKKTGKKKHWREFLLDELEPDQLMVEAEGTAEGKDGDLKFADIMAEDKVDKVGSVDPVNDFTKMMARRDDPEIVNKAIHEMVEMIKSLVRRSFGDQYYQKAVDCLRTLREGCVQQEEPFKFNNSLRDFKALFEKKKEGFWRRVIEAKILPIDTTECDQSDYSPEKAKQFFQSSVSQTISQLSISQPLDEEDEDPLDLLV